MNVVDQQDADDIIANPQTDRERLLVELLLEYRVYPLNEIEDWRRHYMSSD